MAVGRRSTQQMAASRRRRQYGFLVSALLLFLLFAHFNQFFWRIHHPKLEHDREDEHDHKLSPPSPEDPPARERKYLFYGNLIDEPRVKCSGLNHQTSSLRCALEEAWLLNRTFVLPREMCLQARHNQPIGLRLPSEGKEVSMNISSMFDVGALNTSLQGGVVFGDERSWLEIFWEGVNTLKVTARVPYTELQTNPAYQNAQIIHRDAEDFWLVLCWTRHPMGARLFPEPEYAPALKETAEKLAWLLGDFDFVHVRRGDKVKVDRKGRTIYPHLDRDTKPRNMWRRMKKWIPKGRTIYLASDETTPAFFDPLQKWYTVKRPYHFADVFKKVATNNYHVFAIEKMLAKFARVHVGTFPSESPKNFSLSDDPRAGVEIPRLPVHTYADEKPVRSR